MQFRSVIIWGAALGLYSAAIVASFTTFEGSPALNQLQAYPEGMLEAFGVTDLGHHENYLHSQFFVLAPLALAFFPILASPAPSRAPKSAAPLTYCSATPCRAGTWSWAALLPPPSRCSASSPFSGSDLGHGQLVDVDLACGRSDGVLNLWPICLSFGSLALLCSAIFHRRALAIAIPGFLLFGMYLIDAIGRASEDLEDLRPVSVFYYYGSAIENGIDWPHFGSIMLIALSFVLLAALVFRRRDIYT